MSWYPDFHNLTMLAWGDHVRAIGWLSSREPYCKGELPEQAKDRLREFCRFASVCSKALSFAAYGGWHDCEFCGDWDCRGYSGIGVPKGDLLFIAPDMISHYVDEHEYLPPDEFIDALLKSPLPGTDEYALAVTEFRAEHDKLWPELANSQPKPTINLTDRQTDPDPQNGADEKPTLVGGRIRLPIHFRCWRTGKVGLPTRVSFHFQRTRILPDRTPGFDRQRIDAPLHGRSQGRTQLAPRHAPRLHLRGPL